MSAFNFHAIQQAPQTAQPLLEGALQKYGFVPNLLAGLAQSPQTLQAYLTLGDIFSKTSLTPTEQQVVLLTTSIENHCAYCVAAHSLIAKRMVKIDPLIVEALREQQPLSCSKLAALATFTRAVVQQRGKVCSKELDAFINAGYNQQQVLEVVLGVTMKTLSNYSNHLMDTPIDDAFQTEAWELSATPKQCCNA